MSWFWIALLKCYFLSSLVWFCWAPWLISRWSPSSLKEITSAFLENFNMDNMLMRWAKLISKCSNLSLTSTSLLTKPFLHTTRARIHLEWALKILAGHCCRVKPSPGSIILNFSETYGKFLGEMTQWWFFPARRLVWLQYLLIQGATAPAHAPVSLSEQKGTKKDGRITFSSLTAYNLTTALTDGFHSDTVHC